jgi:hypothetical protein
MHRRRRRRRRRSKGIAAYIERYKERIYKRVQEKNT